MSIPEENPPGNAPPGPNSSGSEFDHHPRVELPAVRSDVCSQVRFKNEKEQLLRALLGDEGWGFAWFYMSMLYCYTVIQYYIQYILGRSLSISIGILLTKQVDFF